MKAKERFVIRQHLLLKQNRACAICRKIMNDKLFLDHCHKSNKVRGLLCEQCNSGLGFFKDDVRSLEAAIKYLENPPYLQHVVGHIAQS